MSFARGDVNLSLVTAGPWWYERAMSNVLPSVLADVAASEVPAEQGPVRKTIDEILSEDQAQREAWEREEAEAAAAIMAQSPEGKPWQPLLHRIRIVDKGHGQTFGLRWAAKLEGFEICRARRQHDPGVPLLHYAAALLHVAGVHVDTPTWEVKTAMEQAGVGPPYGRPQSQETHQKAGLLLGLNEGA